MTRLRGEDMKREERIETNEVAANETEKRKARIINTDSKVLFLAKKLKLVIKDVSCGTIFRKSKLCYIEPVRIDQTGAARDAKIVKVGKFKPVFSFTYEHSTVGYKYRYIGANIRECLLAIADTAPKEILSDIERNGGVFTVEEKEGLGGFILNPYCDTVPVKITLYKEKSGKLPDDILNQGIKFRQQEFTPNEISRIVKADLSRNKTTDGEGK